MKRIILATIVLAMTAGLAYAASNDSVKSIELPVVQTELADGPGKDKAVKFCSLCHSLDYITMQPKAGRAQWAGTVNKMIKVFGAPVQEEDAKVIVEYLSTAYGNGK